MVSSQFQFMRTFLTRNRGSDTKMTTPTVGIVPREVEREREMKSLLGGGKYEIS